MKLLLNAITKFTFGCAILAITGATVIMMVPPEKVEGTSMRRVITWQNRIKDFIPFIKDKKAEKEKNDDGKDDQRNYANIAIARLKTSMDDQSYLGTLSFKSHFCIHSGLYFCAVMNI